MTASRILYLDLVGGAAGDMLLAALLDVGASLEKVRASIELLGLSNIEIQLGDARPAGLAARQVNVLIDGRLADTGPAAEVTHGHSHAHDHSHTHRPYRTVKTMIQHASLSAAVRVISLDAFHHLAEAEAKAHGVPVDEVVFHEVGSDDAIVDIVGTATALVDLCIDEVVSSPVPVGRGLTRAAHGPIPLPGMAALHILKGVPIEATSLLGETVTPTGAALLRAVSGRFGPIPSMVLRQVGVGAGHRDWPDRPNVVRALLGEASSVGGQFESEEECVLEANIDDMTPEHLGALREELTLAGAVDVWFVPLHMKKDRVGFLVSALTRQSLQGSVSDAFFIHSTTLGVRTSSVRRRRAERQNHTVDTPYGLVEVKASSRPDGSILYAPEYEDCKKQAAAAQVSVRRVYEAALKLVWAAD